MRIEHDTTTAVIIVRAIALSALVCAFGAILGACVRWVLFGTVPVREEMVTAVLVLFPIFTGTSYLCALLDLGLRSMLREWQPRARRGSWLPPKPAPKPGNVPPADFPRGE